MPTPARCSRLIPPTRGWLLDARSLAVFRIGIGTLLVADALLRTRDFGFFFSTHGFFPPAMLQDYLGPGCWSLCFLSPALAWQGCVLGLEAVAGVCLAAGLWTSVATAAGWIAVVSILRRTAPATNAGDFWLAVMLFWSLWLPLGQTWSVDAWRRGRLQNRGSGSISSPATTVFVLQLLGVYLAAGLSKCNAAWLTGAAVTNALSVHDHGSPLGSWLATHAWVTGPLAWGVVALECLGPAVWLAAALTKPQWRSAIRLSVALLFVFLHAGIWLFMSVGLFGAIGIVAWTAVLPGSVWGARQPEPPPSACRRSTASRLLFIPASLAILAWLHALVTPTQERLPQPWETAVNLRCLHQRWAMFGEIPSFDQWVEARATLSDGQTIDLLRSGKPATIGCPPDGFTGLPHHRWHKLLWVLPGIQERRFAAPVLSTLADDWNRSHHGGRSVLSAELWYGRTTRDRGQGAEEASFLMAAWPPRHRGTGNLERLLREIGPAIRDLDGD
jgi:nitrate reductase NapE component